MRKNYPQRTTCRCWLCRHPARVAFQENASQLNASRVPLFGKWAAPALDSAEPYVPEWLAETLASLDEAA